ncbi:tetratricopeptide repeat protein [Propionivibrio dicarboxylicus]|uniref:Tetratricopeptide repeat-containing protein n=1 Tax=Propionivibrio dicarboxylicus TaxID=83767 RepID=A0A1G8MZU7_9RHOO|nr:tetratricopeptide repeat protein [Propionivibrio dicarboxylicus]SDI72870.1 Tetratricopeptide repeat-containing protein [Propionivibrio dicarboxylicus]
MDTEPTLPPSITRLEKLLGGAHDGALLRYALGNEWLKAGHPSQAAEYLRQSLALDPSASAAWKLLGKALSANGEIPAAIEAFTQGITAATSHGDIQAVKEMTVFLRRLHRGSPSA